MIVGFTGTRQGCKPLQLKALEKLLKTLNISEAHHGDCVGADADFANLVRGLLPREKVVVHPPAESRKRGFSAFAGNIVLLPKSYFARNRDIVDHTEALIGCPLEMKLSEKGGTSYTINYARKKNKPIFIVWPDGSVSEEGSK